ncbi:MAG: shewanella-like protein phosphatase [Polyangiales bacterium]
MKGTWIGLGLLLACGRAQPEHATSASEPAASAPAAAKTPAAKEELKWAAASRVIAIGDMHGDLEAARRALKIAGAIDEADHWAGGALTLVQTGDVLDRGDDDRKIFDWLEQLRPEAKAAGGELILLSGNHELMNVAQDFSYVTPAAFESFGELGGRPSAFRPGGVYALRIALRPFVAQVGDAVYVHGGVLPEHVEYGLARMQHELRAWLAGQGPLPALVANVDSPVWTRAYSAEPLDCERLTRALAMLNAKRMIVGHTPQQHGITSACDEQVWRIDTGMSRFYGGPTEVLELTGDRVRALR